MNLRIGIDVGRETGLVVVRKDGERYVLEHVQMFDRDQKGKVDIEPLKRIEGIEKCIVCFEDLNINRGKPQSVRVLKGLSRMIGHDHAILNDAFGVRFQMVKRQHIASALNLGVNYTKDVAVKKLESFTGIVPYSRGGRFNEHINDAILLTLGGFHARDDDKSEARS